MKRLMMIAAWLLPGACIAQEMAAGSGFDFVPGNQVIYANTLDTETLGELPVGWNTTASGEVVERDQHRWVKLLQNATYITDNQKAFTDNFTVEFDLYLDFTYRDAFFPQVSFGILSTGKEKANANAVLKNLFAHQLLGVDLQTGMENNSLVKLVSYDKGGEYFHSGEKPFKPLENMLRKSLHVSMQVQGERYRVWINDIKLFDVPRALPAGTAINQLFFQVSESSYSNSQLAVYVGNLKVAAGLPDTRRKLLQEGRFTTTGILFDVSSARIRPESAGVLREIADAIQSSPGTKVLIVGHTDSDGQDEDNLRLSRERSLAVKNALVQTYGLDPSVLSTDGKGESQPVAKNDSREGKAQNRRVEFIKQ
jgi:outer membrane protein OmpA-like peptidoglycan-associated protein